MKRFEHLTNVPANKCIAWNSVLYLYKEANPLQLTVILKFNQSHPTKSSKTLFTGATSGSGFFQDKMANPTETKSGKITYICGACFKNKQYKMVMELNKNYYTILSKQYVSCQVNNMGKET